MITEPEQARMLGPTDILMRLPSQDVRELSEIGQKLRFSKGEYVFRAGMPGRQVFFLLSGRIKIYQAASTGKEVLYWFCLAGEMFGFAEVAQGGGRMVNAQACEDSQVLGLSQPQLESYLETHPQAALLMMQALAHRMRSLGDVVVNLVNDDVRTRILKLIPQLGARYGVRVGQDIYLNMQLTHQEIADMVGSTRQSVTTALSQLKRQGLMTLESRRIRIQSRELLELCINHPYPLEQSI